MSTTFEGVISELSGHPMSGLWSMVLEPVEADGFPVCCFVSSGTGVRALAACFGATEGAGDLLDCILGEPIVFTVDEWMCLEAFTPSCDWYAQGLPEIPADGISDEALAELIAEHTEGGIDR